VILTCLKAARNLWNKARLCSLSQGHARKTQCHTFKANCHRHRAAEQAARLKQLAIDAYEPDAFKLNLTQAEAQRRIAVLSAKLPLLDGPPHTL